MEQERRVRCNHCTSTFDEDAIIIINDDAEACPVCKKGDALMDIDAAAPSPASVQSAEELAVNDGSFQTAKDFMYKIYHLIADGCEKEIKEAENLVKADRAAQRQIGREEAAKRYVEFVEIARKVANAPDIMHLQMYWPDLGKALSYLDEGR